MKKYLILFILPLSLFCQEIIPNTITVDASASVSVPAEWISFTVTLSSESDSAQHAYQNHLSLEKKIVDIIKEYHIDTSDVSYSLLSISRQYNSEGRIVYHTTQTVNLKVHDIDKYYDFQITLLEHDLDQFHSRFSVKNEKDLVERGYESALRIATSDAQLLADHIRRKLGKISAVLVRSHSDEVYEFKNTSLRAAQGSLLDVNKIVTKITNLTVMFELY